MPGSVVFAAVVGAAGKAGAAFITGASIFSAAVTGALVGGISGAINYIFRARPRGISTDQQKFKENILGGVQYVRYVYGITRTGGVIIFINEKIKDRTLHMLLYLSEGECDSIISFLFH